MNLSFKVLKNFQCHSGTTKEEILGFLNENAGSNAILHYEENMYPTWGDDHDVTLVLDEKGMKIAHSYVETHYIHDVRIVE